MNGHEYSAGTKENKLRRCVTALICGVACRLSSRGRSCVLCASSGGGLVDAPVCFPLVSVRNSGRNCAIYDGLCTRAEARVAHLRLFAAERSRVERILHVRLDVIVQVRLCPFVRTYVSYHTYRWSYCTVLL